MVRQLMVGLLLGPLVLVVAAGCSSNQGAEIPKTLIPLPKEGPSAAGAGTKKASPATAPKGSSAAQY